MKIDIEAVAEQGRLVRRALTQDVRSHEGQEVEERRYPQVAATIMRQDAEAMVVALKRQLDPLIKELKADEEIGALLTSFGVLVAIRANTIGHEDPNLIIIKGLNDDDEEVTLFQHVSQFNILFKKVKVKPGKQPRRIGFC